MRAGEKEGSANERNVERVYSLKGAIGCCEAQGTNNVTPRQAHTSTNRSRSDQARKHNGEVGAELEVNVIPKERGSIRENFENNRLE